MEKYYIWETERWEVFISQNKEIFKTAFWVNNNVLELITDDWEANKELYKELYKRIVEIYIP